MICGGIRGTSCAPHGACELKSNIHDTIADIPGCAPHGACELKLDNMVQNSIMAYIVAPRMGRVS